MPPTTAQKEYNAQMGSNPELSPYFTVPPELAKAEIAERSFDLYRLYQCSQIRESPQPQFDGMGYSRYNETNEMADISFLAPKKNKGDSRITTGITHEKDTSLVSFFLNLSFEGNVRVFHKDKEDIEMGTALSKLVRKSREMEFYDNKRPLFYRNYVSQGTSFALEEYSEIWVPDKKIIGDIDPTAMDKVKWTDNGYIKVVAGCNVNLVDGKKVFLEDIRQGDIQKQPGVYTVEYVPREIMKGIWGKTSRWKNVPYFVTPTASSLGTLSQGSIYSDWIWGEIDFNKVEVIKVYRPFEQRFQIYLNGVPMLPAGFPLKAVSPSGLIPIAKGDLDLMNLYAYSKSEPAKTKIDQAVFDEILQNMIIKFRQSSQPSRTNMSDRIVTPDMFLGGKIIANLDPDLVKPLIDPAHAGITTADFSFYNLFKEQIDSKTISSLLEGNPSNGDLTLGQYMDMQKKQMLKIGGKIDGIVQWERQMLRLRVMNLLAHGAQKNAQGTYQDMTIADKMGDGTEGLSVMKFTENNTITPEEVFNQQNQYQDQTGQQVEINYLNPLNMKAMIDDPEYYFCYEVVPVDKNNDKLTQMMFVSMVQQAAQLFGPDSLQVADLKKQYAGVMGKPYDSIFKNEQELQQEREQAQAAEMAAANAGVKTPPKPAPGGGGPSMAETMMK